MYNRYIPQSDGSYRKDRFPDTTSSQQKKNPQPSPSPPQQQPADNHKEASPPQPPYSAGNFLKNLLPKDFDTSDLLIILILLLMSEDGQEKSGYSLLTLALYLFL